MRTVSPAGGASWSVLVSSSIVKSRRSACASASCLGEVKLVDQPVGGEHRQTGILQRHEAHHHVAMGALAADLLGVHASGFVAMMPVGDQQLGARQHPLDGLDRLRVGGPAQPVDRPVVVGRLRPRRRIGQRAPRLSAGVGVQREDRREVGAGRPRQSQPVLLGSRMGPLVGADAARAVVLHAHAREEALPGAVLPVGAGVVLAERPQRRFLVLDDDARPPSSRAAARPPGRSDPRRPRAGRCARRCRANGPPARPAARRRSRHRAVRRRSAGRR